MKEGKVKREKLVYVYLVISLSL